MRSSGPVWPPDHLADDRSTAARIRDAAITRIAATGVRGTTIRDIAEAAEVSPALVMHHFGSKHALMAACDHHVASLIRAQKLEAMQTGGSLDPVAALRTSAGGPPLVAYLARTLIDGTPAVADLIDELLQDAVDYLAAGEASGVVRPTEQPRERAAVLLLWSLGALVLHEHAARVLDVDLLGEPTQLLGYLRPAFEILGQGVLTPETYAGIATTMEPVTDGPQEE